MSIESQTKKNFNIATCNSLNLALPHRVYYKNSSSYTQDEYARKISGLYDILKFTQSDILAFQEIWDEKALIELVQKLGFSSNQVLAPMASNDIDNKITFGRGAESTPALGLVSKFDVIKWSLLTDFDEKACIEVPDQGLYTKFNRPPLIVTYDIYGQPVTIVTAHLKSKRPHYLRNSKGESLEDYDDPKTRVRAKLRSLCMRGAEAAALRLHIVQILSNTHHPLILLGDMNDVTQSVTTQLLSETNEVQYDKQMRDMALFDAARVQVKYEAVIEKAYTHLYQGMPEVIDQLFVSEEFVHYSKYAIGSVKQVSYYNDHLKREYVDRVTDHGIVSAHIKLF